MEKNYYDVLGVSKNATQDEIKKKYRELSKKLHPDVNKSSDAEDRFKELNEAYGVLSNPDKRRNYDTYGTADPQPSFGNGFGGFNPFGDGFNPFGGFGFGKRERTVEKGSDVKIKIKMSFEDLFYGAHKKIKIKKQCTCHRCNGSGSETNDSCECPECHGTGYVTKGFRQGNMMTQSMTVCHHCHGTGSVIKDPCPNCDGTGLEEKMTEVEFDIPAGMMEDAYFVVRGKGNDGPHRGVPGNLLVMVEELPSKNGLTRTENNDIVYTAKIPYKDLVFGTDVEIPYINSKKKIHVEGGTETGKTLRLYRMGFPNPNDPSQKGDYIVTIQCEIPKVSDMTVEEQEKIKAL